MTDRDDQKPSEKSRAALVAITRSNEVARPRKQEKRHLKDIHYQISSAMLGRPLGWHSFPAKLYRWTDAAGVSIPYAENEAGIVHKISDDGLRYLIAYYWDQVLIQGDRPVFLEAPTADSLDRVRRLWLALATPVTTKFLTLGWKSEPRAALHKLDFDPSHVTAEDCPLFAELMSRTTNSQTFMAWIGSLFDEHSQRQQYAWVFGGGGNGKSALVRVLLAALGPVGASESPPTRDAKHWTCGLSNRRLVVFPDCNNVAFVTSGEFKQLTGEDPVRMEPKGKSVYYENIDAKFLIVSNEEPVIPSKKADLRRVLFFEMGDIPEHARVDHYEELLRKEAPAFISLCWQVYQEMTQGNSRYEFSASKEIGRIVDDAEHELEAFVDGKLCLGQYESYGPNKKLHVIAQEMLKMMHDAGFRTEYERRRLRSYMERKHGITRTKIFLNDASRLVYLNCKTAPSG